VDTLVVRVEHSGVLVSVTLNETRHRFEITAADQPGDAEPGVLEFRLVGTVASMNHTQIPVTLRGRGLGDVLVRAALDYARSQGWQVRPRCPFVAAFITAHPEYAALVAPEPAAPRQP
jgi:predicted GNAT family acetyltransferase